VELSREPDKIDDPSPAMLRYAEASGLRIVPVLVAAPEVGDGAQFNALVKSVPRIGERLVLSNGRTCQVTCVDHRVSVLKADGESMVAMLPTVLAVLQSEGGSDVLGRR